MNARIVKWYNSERSHSPLRYLRPIDAYRSHVPLSLDDARQLVAAYIAHYNHVRLHSAICYVTRTDKLAA